MSEGNGKAWGPEIKDLGDKIVALTVAKAVELGNYLEEVHGIKPAASAVALMRCTTCAAVNAGNLARTRAATPATYAASYGVPLRST